MNLIVAQFTLWTLLGIAKMHTEQDGHVHNDVKHVITLQRGLYLAQAFHMRSATAHFQRSLWLLSIVVFVKTLCLNIPP